MHVRDIRMGCCKVDKRCHAYMCLRMCMRVRVYIRKGVLMSVGVWTPGTDLFLIPAHLMLPVGQPLSFGYISEVP
jgi:hypothetical protein